MDPQVFMIGGQAMQLAKKRTKWSPEEIEFLKENHLKLSYKEMAYFLNKTYASVNCKITRLKIGDNTPNYKYTLKERALESQDFSGYIAGLWAADGHLHYDSGRVSHKFNKKDEKYLKYIYSILVNERPELRPESSNSNMVTFRATLPSFREYLESIGITSQKTYTLSVDFSKQSDLWSRHFISGYLDGDGWVYTPEKRYNQKIGFVSSGKILFDIQNFLGYGKLYSRNSYHTLIFCSKQSLKLSKYLENNKYQFPRKKDNIKKIISSFNKNTEGGIL